MGLILLVLLFLLLFCAPVAAISFFIVSLIMFISLKSQNKKIPDSVDSNKMYVRKICLIISSIIFGFFVAAFITVIILFSGAVSFM
jgi:hypothetical protein